MAIVRKIDGLSIVWTNDRADDLEPMVDIRGTIADDVEMTKADASWTFVRSELSPSAAAKLDAFLADVLGHVQGKLGAGRPVSLPV